MSFNSYEFVLFFLPLACLMHNLIIRSRKINSKLINLFLLTVSVIFYLFAGVKGCIVILIVTGVNFLFYKLIAHFVQLPNRGVNIVLISGVIFNLIVLLYFKYYNFFVDNINLICHQQIQIKTIIQPLGLSFLVFQQIAFLVDASRNEVEKCGFVKYLTFMLFFPHISSGPILLHKDMFPLLDKEHRVEWENISSGIYLFVMGLGKKVLIADALAEAVDWGYANVSSLNSTSAVWVTVLYTLQIYFDFSGYSDMAIGVSRLLQLDLPINFNSPYKSKTILEFWDRWHITLTRFLTKYLYIPLGGSRKGTVRTYLNTMVVFFLSGLWHGASYTFILWGGLHGCFMVITKRFSSVFDRIPGWINHGITLFFVNFTWILFRSGSLSTFKQMLNVIAEGSWGILADELCEPLCPLTFQYYHIDISMQLWAVIAVLLIWFVVLSGKNVYEKAECKKYFLGNCICVIIIAVLCVVSFGGVNTFIYSNF